MDIVNGQMGMGGPMMVGTKWKVIQEASSFELRQGGMGGMAMMNPMMVHPSPSSTSLL